MISRPGHYWWMRWPALLGGAGVGTLIVRILPRPVTAAPVLPPWVARPLDALSRLASTDFSRPRTALLLGVIVTLTRLPWINLGYGSDADAWRVAITARWLWAHGEYFPSRLPGYPVHELSAVLLIWGGWLATNTATLVMSLAGIYLFATIVRLTNSQPRGLLTLSFSFTPLLWINSTVTMDYMWALTLVLASYLLLLRDRPALAGVVLGLASGCRLISFALVGPFALPLLRRRQWRELARMVAALALTFVVVYAPLLLRYGSRMFNFADWRPTWGQFARTMGVEAAGLMAFGVLALVALLSLPRLRRLPAMTRRDPQFATWLVAVLLIAAAFFRLPLEEAYFILLVPFLYLMLARWLWRPLFVLACAGIVTGGVLDLHTDAPNGWKSPLAVLYLRPDRGRLIVDWELRRQRMQIVREAHDTELFPRRDSVLTMGYYFPIMAELYHDEFTLRFREEFDPRIIGPLTDITEAVDANNRVYVWLLNEGQVRRYRYDGYSTWTMNYDGKEGLQVEMTLNPAYDRFGPR